MRGKVGIAGDIIGLSDVKGNPTDLAKRIAACHPDFVGAGICSCGYESCEWAPPNITKQVVKFFHDHGIKEVRILVCNSGNLGFCKTPFEEHAKPMLDHIFNTLGKVDAIWDGEVHNFENKKSGHDQMVKFFTDYSNYVRSKGSKLYFNTGTWYTFKETKVSYDNQIHDIMALCDVLSSEYCQGHPEKLFTHAPRIVNGQLRMDGEWTKEFPPERFSCSPLGYNWFGTIDEAEAKVREMWRKGFHYVSVTFSRWRGWGDGTIYPPFPERYDWWDRLIWLLTQPEKYTVEEVQYCADRFGQKVGDPNYVSACDINGDGFIDMKDIGFMARNIDYTPPPPPSFINIEPIDVDIRVFTHIVDLRTKSVCLEGHIPHYLVNHRCIPYNDLINEKLGSLAGAHYDKILVYCQSGSTSARAAQYLVDNGYEYVFNLVGGFDNWVDSGLDTSTCPLCCNP